MHIARSACFSMVLEIVEIKLERKICYLLLQKIYTILFLMIISKKKKKNRNISWYSGS